MTITPVNLDVNIQQRKYRNLYKKQFHTQKFKELVCSLFLPTYSWFKKHMTELLYSELIFHILLKRHGRFTYVTASPVTGENTTVRGLRQPGDGQDRSNSSSGRHADLLSASPTQDNTACSKTVTERQRTPPVGAIQNHVAVVHDNTMTKSVVTQTAATQYEQVTHTTATQYEQVNHTTATQYEQVTHTTATQYEQVTHTTATQYEQVNHTTATQYEQVTHTAATQYAQVTHTAATQYAPVTRTAATQYEQLTHTTATQYEQETHTAATQYEQVTQPVAKQYRQCLTDTFDEDYSPADDDNNGSQETVAQRVRFFDDLEQLDETCNPLGLLSRMVGGDGDLHQFIESIKDSTEEDHTNSPNTAVITDSPNTANNTDSPNTAINTDSPNTTVSTDSPNTAVDSTVCNQPDVTHGEIGDIASSTTCEAFSDEAVLSHRSKRKQRSRKAKRQAKDTPKPISSSADTVGVLVSKETALLDATIQEKCIDTAPQEHAGDYSETTDVLQADCHSSKQPLHHDTLTVANITSVESTTEALINIDSPQIATTPRRQVSQLQKAAKEEAIEPSNEAVFSRVLCSQLCCALLPLLLLVLLLLLVYMLPLLAYSDCGLANNLERSFRVMLIHTDGPPPF